MNNFEFIDQKNLEIKNKLLDQFHKTRLTKEVHFVLTAEEAYALLKEFGFYGD